MQRRIEQPDADRLPLHDAEELHKILTLHRQQPFKHRRAVAGPVGKNHLAHHGQTTGVKEHMLRPAQPDALRIEVPRGLRIRRCVGIGANIDIAFRVRPSHQRLERIVKRRLKHLRLAREDLPRGSVQRDDVARLEHAPVRRHDLLAAVLELERRRPHDTGQAKPPTDHRRMARHAAPFGQNPDRCVHSANVLRRGLAPHKDTGFAPRRAGLCLRRGEHDPARRRAGAGGNAGAKNVALGMGRDLPVQQFVQHARLDPHHGFLRGDDPVLSQTHRDPNRRARRARHADTV